MATNRSNRAEVRNPVLGLPAFSLVLDLPPDARRAIREVCRALAADATERANKCWRTHKAPMAAYWKCVAVYAGHTARAISRSLKETSSPPEGPAATQDSRRVAS